MFKYFRRHWAKISEINKKYSTPKIEMSMAVKISLMFLRIYLLILVGLLVFKFITLLK